MCSSSTPPQEWILLHGIHPNSVVLVCWLPYTHQLSYTNPVEASLPRTSFFKPWQCSFRNVLHVLNIYKPIIICPLHAHMHVRTHTHTYIRSHKRTYAHTHVHACTYMYTHAHTCTHTHIHTLAQTYICTCTYTHTHTHTDKLLLFFTLGHNSYFDAIVQMMDPTNFTFQTILDAVTVANGMRGNNVVISVYKTQSGTPAFLNQLIQQPMVRTRGVQCS